MTTKSAEETQALAQRLGSACLGGEVLLLSGPLGAGKTAFTQGLARGLGVTEYVHSPTFTLVNQYEGRLTLYHLDLYRIDSLAEAVDLGLDDYLYTGGVAAIEWAEKALEALPAERLQILFSQVGATERRLQLNASGAVHERLVHAAAAAVKSTR